MLIYFTAAFKDNRGIDCLSVFGGGYFAGCPGFCLVHPPAAVELVTSFPWTHVKTKMEGSRESWTSGWKPVWSSEMCSLVQHTHSLLAQNLALIHKEDSSAWKTSSAVCCRSHWRSAESLDNKFLFSNVKCESCLDVGGGERFITHIYILKSRV